MITTIAVLTILLATILTFVVTRRTTQRMTKQVFDPYFREEGAMKNE